MFRARFKGRVDISPGERPGSYRITARDYVGRVWLAPNRLLYIEPKVEVANLFYMLCGATNAVAFYMPPIALAPRPDIYSLLLRAILDESERLLTRGLQQDYAEREESLGLIRGRIALSAQVSRYGELKERHICRFAELTHDTRENRVVAATLRFAAGLLFPETERHLLKRLRELLAHFAGVSPCGRGDALSSLRQIRKHRLNMAYWPLLDFCRLLLNGLTLSEHQGRLPFPSFLVNMSQLFETVLTKRLQRMIPKNGLRVVAQRHDYLDISGRVGIRPDILVCDSTMGKPLLVLDAKYKLLNSGSDDLNRDIYQISAYMDRYELKRGVLVYPRWERSLNAKQNPTQYRFKNSPKELFIATINLAAPGPAALDQEYTALAEHVSSLVPDL